MDREFAIMTLNACFRASRELGETGTMVKAFSSDEAGLEIKSQIGMAIAEIGNVMESVFKLHPDLRDWIDERIEKYGRVS
jgi:hypothetical protein